MRSRDLRGRPTRSTPRPRAPPPARAARRPGKAHVQGVGQPSVAMAVQREPGGPPPRAGPTGSRRAASGPRSRQVAARARTRRPAPRWRPRSPCRAPPLVPAAEHERRSGVPRRTYSAPTPLGAYSLWPATVSRSTPSACTSTGTLPTDCAASVCTTRAAPRGPAPRLRHGLQHARLVVGVHQSARTSAVLVPERRAASSQAHAALGVHAAPGSPPSPGAPAWRTGRAVAGCSMVEVSTWRRLAPSRRGAADGEVVGLGAAGGEEDLLGLAPSRPPPARARLLHRGRARRP